jgi:hypothetical protein
VAFSSHIHWFLLLCLIAASAAFSFWAYRVTIPPVGRAKKTVLVALRAVTLALVIVLIAEPLLHLTRLVVHKPVVALVADNSLSMTLTDASGSREARLRSIFGDRNWERISSDAVIERYQIEPGLARTSADSLSLRGASTDLAQALTRLLDEQEGDHPAAVVLLSDGNYNTGANPLADAERSKVPIFTIGIGDSSDQKDASVQKLAGNSIAYVETSVPLDAVVKVSGFPGASLGVELLEEGRAIDTQTLRTAASSEPSEYSIRFSYVPKTEGMKRLTVRVQHLAGEATEKNNSRSIVMKVLKNKLRTVVVAGTPGADAAAVMQMLEADKNGEPSIFYQTPDGRLRTEKTGAPSFPSASQTADCIVLVGFPTAQTTAQNLQTVTTAVRSRNIPLLFISGRLIDLQKLKELEGLLPFTVAGARVDEQQVVASIPPAQASNPLVAANQSSAVWEKLPPIYASLGVFKAKPEAAVLATMKMQGVPLTVPLIVSRSVGAQKSIAILGYGISRWKLLAGASSETEQFFSSWFSTAARWLAVREEDKRLRVEPEKELFSQGEPVQFMGQAYTETLEPLENAEIRIEALEQGAKQKFETIMQPSGAGRYEAVLGGLPEGDYAFTASAQFNAQPIGVVHGRFAVGAQALEFTDTKLNATLMRQIAAISGGMYANAADYQSVIEGVKSRALSQRQEHAAVREIDMWNAPLLFFVIIICAGTEWFLRKRSGMV